MTETEDYDESMAFAAHKTSHQDGGSDELSIAALSGEAADEQRSAWAKVSGKPTTFPPAAHKVSHQDGGADKISIAGLLGEATDEQKSAWAKVSGKPATFPPSGHHAEHEPGGADAISFPSEVSDVAYNETTWNDVTGIAPSKNAVRDKIVSLDAVKHTQGTDTALGAVGTKDPPIDADLLLYRDSASLNVLVTSTWTQVKAFLKTYLDTLYQAVNTAILKSIGTTRGDIVGFSENATPSRLGVGADTHVLTADSVEATGLKWAAAGGTTSDYVKVSDVKAYNVNGGTFTAGAWRTRDINTEDSDVSAICSIDSNQITLEAGTYTCSITAPAYMVNQHFGVLYNIDEAAITLKGTSQRSNAGNLPTCNKTLINGKFTIGAQTIFEVQHYCITTRAGEGFGIGTTVSGIDSIYTIAEFWRVAT